MAGLQGCCAQLCSNATASHKVTLLDELPCELVLSAAQKRGVKLGVKFGFGRHSIPRCLPTAAAKARPVRPARADGAHAGRHPASVRCKLCECCLSPQARVVSV